MDYKKYDEYHQKFWDYSCKKHDHCCKEAHCCKCIGENPSYGTFWQNDFVTVELQDAFPFNFSGPSTPDICLINPKSIKVHKEGVYHISYTVTVDVFVNDNPSNTVEQRISVYVNGIQQPNSQTGFGIAVPDIPSCIAISGDAIIYIPENSTLQLKNDGPFGSSSSITTCDNGINAATFNIIKID